MDPQWDDSQPIYRQLRDRVVAMILEGALKEGDPLPSVRSVAAEYQINPLTVLKGYQSLVDEGLVEKRRGLGMFVKRCPPQPDEGREAVPRRTNGRSSRDRAPAASGSEIAECSASGWGWTTGRVDAGNAKGKEVMRRSSRHGV